MAHHGDQLPVAARLHPQHAKAVAGIVKRDALDRSGQHLPGLPPVVASARRIARGERASHGGGAVPLGAEASLAETNPS